LDERDHIRRSPMMSGADASRIVAARTIRAQAIVLLTDRQLNKPAFDAFQGVTLQLVSRRISMISKSKLATVAFVATVGVVTPAFAQALQTGTAANRAQLYGSSSAPSQYVPYGRRADRANGLGAFAMVPGSAFVTRHGPATSGGGSIGYNQYLLKDN
jgi:hypothetical protein